MDCRAAQCNEEIAVDEVNAMAEPMLGANEMLAWLEHNSTKWKMLLEAHPEVLRIPCSVAEVATAGGLLQHIVAVELRYAERLADLPATDYAAIAFDSPGAIYATHDRAMKLLREQIERDVDWNERIEFPTRSVGKVRASRKAVLFHSMLHSIRHYAQLATLTRESGIKPDWPMDYLPMDMERL
jgi:uncharacterized damage-inducible protein DinB